MSTDEDRPLPNPHARVLSAEEIIRLDRQEIRQKSPPMPVGMTDDDDEDENAIDSTDDIQVIETPMTLEPIASGDGDDDDESSFTDIDGQGLTMADSQGNLLSTEVGSVLPEIVHSEEDDDDEKSWLYVDPDDDSFLATLKSMGIAVLDVVDFLGEVFAEFFGMTQSRYQPVIDAYNRKLRWEEEDRKREAYAKALALREAMRENAECDGVSVDGMLTSEALNAHMSIHVDRPASIELKGATKEDERGVDEKDDDDDDESDDPDHESWPEPNFRN